MGAKAIAGFIVRKVPILVQPFYLKTQKKNWVLMRTLVQAI